MNENIERVLAELDGFRMADEITYAAYSRLHDLISELDDLLKAQEPRAMTLEEVVKTERNTPIYIDQRYGMYGWDIYDGVDIQAKDIVTGAPWASNEFWGWDEYGKTWRCWTSRPTDKRRAATPWVEPQKEG